MDEIPSGENTIAPRIDSLSSAESTDIHPAWDYESESLVSALHKFMGNWELWLNENSAIGNDGNHQTGEVAN